MASRQLHAGQSRHKAIAYRQSSPGARGDKRHPCFVELHVFAQRVADRADRYQTLDQRTIGSHERADMMNSGDHDFAGGPDKALRHLTLHETYDGPLSVHRRALSARAMVTELLEIDREPLARRRRFKSTMHEKVRITTDR